MSDGDDEPLQGDVEIDETFWGGKPRGVKPRFGLTTCAEGADQDDRSWHG